MKITNFFYFCFIFICAAQYISAQTTQSYTGPYNLKSYPGNATYAYYQNKEMARVKHGAFTFKATGQNPFGQNISVAINGKFDHGAPTGHWTFSRTVAGGKSETASGSFALGKQTGTWTFTENNPSQKLNGTLQYSQGNITDYNITSKGTSWSFNYTVTGKANSDNYVTGLIKMNYQYQNIYLQETRQYHNGVLLKQLVIDNQDGSIQYDKTLDSTSQNIVKALENGTNPADLGFQFSQKTCDPEPKWMTETRVRPCALVDQMLYNSIVQEMKELEFKEIAVRYLIPAKTRADLAKELEEANKKRAADVQQEKKTALLNLKQSYPQYNLLPLDTFAQNVAELRILIREADNQYNLRISQPLLQERKIVYKKYQALGDTLIEDMNAALDIDIALAIPKSNQVLTYFQDFAQSMQKDNYPQSYIDQIDTQNQLIYQQILADRANYPSLKAQAAEKQRQADAQAKAEKERQQAQAAEKQRQADAQAKLKNEQRNRENYLINNSYQQTQNIQLYYAPNGQIKKKELYRCYLILSEHYKTALANAQNLEDKLTILEQRNNCYNYLINIVSQNTKSIEKQLKGISEPAEIIRRLAF